MHLLPTVQETLDEQDQAIDLGQTPAEIVVLSFTDTDLSALAAAWRGNRAHLPTMRLASLKRLKHPMSVDLYVDSVIGNARAVLIRSLGGLDYWRYGFEEVARIARERGIDLYCLPGDDRPDPRLAALSSVPETLLDHVDRCLRLGGPQNVRSALSAIAARLGTPLAPEPPRPVPAAGHWEFPGLAVTPDRIARPRALLLFYRSALMAGDTAPIAALARALSARGLDPFPCYVTSLKDPEAARILTRMITERRPAIILNTTAFSARRDDGSTVLDLAGVPVIQAVLAGTSRALWEKDGRGLSATDLAMNVVLPEIDGRIGTRAISFKERMPADGDLEFEADAHAPDEGGVATTADLAAGWVRLAAKARNERAIAIILPDYPARGGRAGYAVGLDTGQSLRVVLGLLAAAGYDTQAPAPDDQIVRSLEDGRETLDIALEDYRLALPDAHLTAIDTVWGPPEEDPRFRNGAFHLPVRRFGKVLVALQPERADAADRKTAYHDMSRPPRHAFAAFYLALRHQAGIDALVPFGTHGTLEWLPGKALALSGDCWPALLTRGLPVIYPFIVNNPGEAAVARRRIAAVTLGHMTPPLKAAGLHGAAFELERLLDEYAEADRLDPRRAKLLRSAILEEARRTGFAGECGVRDEMLEADALQRLDAQLCDQKELAIRDGLHVLGQSPRGEARASLALALANADPETSLRDALAEDIGRPAGRPYTAGASVAAPRERLALDTTALGLIAGGVDPEPHRPATARALSLIRDRILPKLDAIGSAESDALLSALDGRFIPAGPAGAPTRGRLDVLPTGRNLATLDPRQIPTRTAALLGGKAADEVIRRHLQDEGDWPRRIVLDLWASPAMRTGGEELATGLALMGVRPLWDYASARVTGIEAIPIAKLARPRVDVTLRVSGLFRDVFPAQMGLFDQAVRLVARLDEEDADNPLAQARRKAQSLDRVWGSAPGSFGTGAARQALDGDWGERAELGATYLASATHTFGAQGEARPAQGFAERVATSDALVHVQDDRERDILDADGVADYVGGYAAAKGSHAALYHLDTSAPGAAPRARTLAEEIARVVRGRVANPAWIAGQMRHGHRGAAEFAQAVEAVYAFAATAGIVTDHQFDAVHQAFVADEMVRAFILTHNPRAGRAIAERLEDAIRRGLWKPRRNAVAAELRLMAGEVAS